MGWYSGKLTGFITGGLIFITGAKRREFSGMIHWLTINNSPSNPQQPIHSLRLAPVSHGKIFMGISWSIPEYWKIYGKIKWLNILNIRELLLLWILWHEDNEKIQDYVHKKCPGKISRNGWTRWSLGPCASMALAPSTWRGWSRRSAMDKKWDSDPLKDDHYFSGILVVHFFGGLP